MKTPRLIPDSEVCRRYGVVAYTLWRWDHNKPELGFPKPVKINGRKYRVADELDRFDAQRAAERDARLDQRNQSSETSLLDAEARLLAEIATAPDEAYIVDLITNNLKATAALPLHERERANEAIQDAIRERRSCDDEK
jgi:hypothetical protein